MVKGQNKDMINLQSLEIICRKVHGIQLAYKPVKVRSDWERPSSSSKGSWEGKMLTGLIREYDIAPEEDEEVMPISGADSELRKSLRDRVVLSKHLGQLGST